MGCFCRREDAGQCRCCRGATGAACGRPGQTKAWATTDTSRLRPRSRDILLMARCGRMYVDALEGLVGSGLLACGAACVRVMNPQQPMMMKRWSGRAVGRSIRGVGLACGSGGLRSERGQNPGMPNGPQSSILLRNKGYVSLAGGRLKAFPLIMFSSVRRVVEAAAVARGAGAVRPALFPWRRVAVAV